MFKNEYALYKGDKLLAIGTVEELAEIENVKNQLYYFIIHLQIKSDLKETEKF